MFKLSSNSLMKLVGVNIKLVNIVKEAILITPVDFCVVYGTRTREEQYALWRSNRDVQGNTLPNKEWKTSFNGTLHGSDTPEGSPGTGLSKHQLGLAVDLAAVVDNKIDWNNLELYTKIAEAMYEASSKLATPIRWGGDYIIDKDYDHFELVNERTNHD